MPIYEFSDNLPGFGTKNDLSTTLKLYSRRDVEKVGAAVGVKKIECNIIN